MVLMDLLVVEMKIQLVIELSNKIDTRTRTSTKNYLEQLSQMMHSKKRTFDLDYEWRANEFRTKLK